MQKMRLQPELHWGTSRRSPRPPSRLGRGHPSPDHTPLGASTLAPPALESAPSAYTTDSCTAAIRNDLYMKPSIHIPTTCSAVLPRRMPAARCSSAESARSPPILPSGLTLIHNVHGKKSDPRMEGEKGPH